MKIFYSFLCLMLLSTLGVAQVNFPITFDDAGVDYMVEGFGGNVGSIVVDPTDPTNMVLQAVKPNDAMDWAGVTIGTMGLTSPVPFTDVDNKFTVRVWSPDANIPVALKLEKIDNNNVFVQKEVMTTVAGQWETLEYDFSDAGIDPNIDYEKAVIFFNLGTTGVGEKTYYADDITFVPAPPPTVDLPITFDNAVIDYGFFDLNGNTTTIIEDPTDATNMVAQTVRSVTASNFAFTAVANDGLTNPIPFSDTEKKMTVRVWSPEAGIIIRLKAENSGSPAIFGQVDVISTVESDWETLIFDFDNLSGGSIDLANTYDKVTVFFNFGIGGATAGEQTFYWDDVQMLEPDQVDLPITFEETNTDYNFGDFGGSMTSIVEDLTNPTNMVAQTIKPADAVDFAGVIAGDDGMANPIPFSENYKTMSVRVYSPDAGITVKLKVEDADNDQILAEVDATTTVANQWETLTFDFNNPVNGGIDLNNTYDKVVLFFNFGVTGATAGEKTYFFDDIQFVFPTEPELPLNFEFPTIDYSIIDFNGSASSIVEDPTDPTNTVVESNKPMTAAENAGVVIANNGLVDPIPFAANAQTMSMRVWSPDADIPVRMKVESVANPAVFAEVDMMTTVAGDWETLTYDFSAPVNGSIDLNEDYGKVVLLFNIGTDGMTAGDKTYYFDDIQFVPPVLDPVDLPITFEDINIGYNLVDFEGNTSMIVTDPTDPMNTVGQITKPVTAGSSAGTTLGGNGLLNPIPFTASNTKMTVRVWSPTANTPLLLKVEKLGNPTIFVETQATTTAAMTWETIEFDFSNPGPNMLGLDFNQDYDMVSIFMNFGTDGATAGEQTYYFDDVMFDGTPPLDQVDLPVTFEDAMTDYDFINFGEATSQVVVDPTDPTNMVMETIKPDNAATFAGTIIGNDNGFVNEVPFTATELKMKVDVWSPQADVPVLLKMEDKTDGNIFVQTITNTTVAMGWETLEFDFANLTSDSPPMDFAQTYDKGVIFFNFDIAGADAGSLTFYWDNVEFGGIDISTENVAKANIKVSPNPASTFINIEFPQNWSNLATATLMDVSGRVLLQNVMNNRLEQLDINGFDAGTYFLRIDTAENSYYEKLVIVK
ncbi:MAG: T9SS type A sorting domain-containing protein [Saprospiraceae bacterium]